MVSRPNLKEIYAGEVKIFVPKHVRGPPYWIASLEVVF